MQAARQIYYHEHLGDSWVVSGGMLIEWRIDSKGSPPGGPASSQEGQCCLHSLSAEELPMPTTSAQSLALQLLSAPQNTSSVHQAAYYMCMLTCLYMFRSLSFFFSPPPLPCVCAGTCMCVCGGHRTALSVVPQAAFTISSPLQSLPGLELTKQARLAGQEAPGSASLPPCSSLHHHTWLF